MVKNKIHVVLFFQHEVFFLQILTKISIFVIESSFDPGERLQAPGSLWFSERISVTKFSRKKLT
jgi:hypothetical protein